MAPIADNARFFGFVTSARASALDSGAAVALVPGVAGQLVPAGSRVINCSRGGSLIGCFGPCLGLECCVTAGAPASST